MSHRIVILGAGTGGTLVANRLRRTLRGDAEITVVDQDNNHVYQPGLLFVPFGLKRFTELTRSRRAQLHDHISYHQSAIDHVDVAHDAPRTLPGRSWPATPEGVAHEPCWKAHVRVDLLAHLAARLPDAGDRSHDARTRQDSRDCRFERVMENKS